MLLNKGFILLSVLAFVTHSEAWNYFDDGDSGSDTSLKAFPCPLAEDISPCVCSFENDKLSLDCTEVSSEEELEDVFSQDFPVTEFHTFSMDHSEIRYLNMSTNNLSFELFAFYPGPFQFEVISDTFLNGSAETMTDFGILSSPIKDGGFPFSKLEEYTQLRQLFLEDVDLTYLPEIRSNSLRDLRVAISEITEFEPNALDGGTGIWNYYFQHNQLSELEARTFPIHFEVIRIKLEYNNIERIAPGAFYYYQDEMPGLSALYLNDNLLSELQAETIPFTRSSTAVRLDHNHISTIEQDAFYVMGEAGLNSIYLYLGHNNLTRLEQNVFEPIMTYLSDLDVRANPLECGCDIAWLILNTAYMSKVTEGASCQDGVLVADLDPQLFLDLC